MPFQERSIVSEREEFCRLASTEGANVRELCRRFTISPTTGHLWLARWRAEGRNGLSDRSRRPGASPSRTPAAIEAAVLAVRHDHPAWGGRKIRRVLEVDGSAAPAASTITAILRRAGCLDGPRSGEPRTHARFEHPAPNDLWQMDFKGHFALASGRCHPLTVIDDHSRYALEIGACADERTETVAARLERVFRRHGLPERILADNGSPWGTTGSGDTHTRLTVWLLDLGVRVIHGRPYHPQTQGKDERFHRTLKAEALDGRLFPDLAAAQKAFEAWREIYNSRRPHEALGLATPASRYRMSGRSMPQTVEPPDYETDAHVRTVHDRGWISFRGRAIPCSKAFVGRRVALRPTETDGVWDLCYRSHRLTTIDLRGQAQTVQDVPEHPSTMSPV
jgi:transposase InsO family protein